MRTVLAADKRVILLVARRAPGLEGVTCHPWEETHIKGQTLNVSPDGGEFSRLISAAIVSQEFCHLLLANPAAALATGYNGESFRLAPEERQWILSIHASSLAGFAMQLAENGHKGIAHKGD
jgi:hypothetical protein